MVQKEQPDASLQARRDAILAAVQSNPEFAQQAVDLLRSLGLIPAEATQPQEIQTLAAAQHVYTRVPWGQSLQRFEGWQSYAWTAKGEGALSDSDVRYLEHYFQVQRNIPPGVRERWEFFPFSDGRVAFSRIVPRLETDRSGRTYLFLSHSMVLSPSEYEKLPQGTLSLWNNRLYKKEPYDFEKADRGDSPWHLPLQQLDSRTFGQLQTTDFLSEDIEKQLGELSAARLGQLLRERGEPQLATLLELMGKAKEMKEERRSIVIYGKETEIIRILRLVHRLAKLMPNVSEKDLSFTTWADDENTIPYFWAVGTTREPRYGSDKRPVLDAGLIICSLDKFRVGEDRTIKEPEVAPGPELELPTKGGELETNVEIARQVSEQYEGPVTLQFEEPVFVPPGMEEKQLVQEQPLSIQGKKDVNPETGYDEYSIEKITIDAKRLQEAGIDPQDISLVLLELKIRMTGRKEVALLALDALEKGNFEAFAKAVQELKKEHDAFRGMYGLDDSQPFSLSDEQ